MKIFNGYAREEQKINPFYCFIKVWQPLLLVQCNFYHLLNSCTHCLFIFLDSFRMQLKGNYSEFSTLNFVMWGTYKQRRIESATGPARGIKKNYNEYTHIRHQLTSRPEHKFVHSTLRIAQLFPIPNQSYRIYFPPCSSIFFLITSYMLIFLLWMTSSFLGRVLNKLRRMLLGQKTSN